MADEEKTGWEALYGERTLGAIRTDVRHPFDADASGCALELDGMTILVFEDPNDGYRSAARDPIIIKKPIWEFAPGLDYLRVPVLVRAMTASESADGADGIELIDRRNGKTILRLGTNNLDDYYPSYTCEWSPQNLAENVDK